MARYLLPLCVTVLLAAVPSLSLRIDTIEGKDHFKNVVKVWSDSEMAQCKGNFGPPLVTSTPTGEVYVVGRCCAEDACVKSSEEEQHGNGKFGDPMVGAYSVIKKATDSQASGWDDSTFYPITKPYDGRGYVGAIVYDFVHERLFALSTSLPNELESNPLGGHPGPQDHGYWTHTSTDGGKTWNVTNVTEQIFSLRPGGDHGSTDMSISAGNKIIVEEGPYKGRIVIPMRNSPSARLVYTDDGGRTFHASNTYHANENSVSTCPTDNKTLVLVGRPQPGTGDYEAQYYSQDGGNSVKPEDGEKSQLPTDTGNHDKGCERSLLNVENAIISCEPIGHARRDLVCSCSKDCGKSWPHSITFSENSGSGYSNLAPALGGGAILVMQNEKAHAGTPHNFVSAWIKGGWCH